MVSGSGAHGVVTVQTLSLARREARSALASSFAKLPLVPDNFLSHTVWLEKPSETFYALRMSQFDRLRRRLGKMGSVSGSSLKL